MTRFRVLRSFVIVPFMVLFVVGQQADKTDLGASLTSSSEIDTEMQKADEAEDEAQKIVEEVSREPEDPEGIAAASDPLLQGDMAANDTTPIMSTMQAEDETAGPAEFMGAQLDNAPRLSAGAKQPAVSALAHEINQTRHSGRHLSKKAAESRKQLPQGGNCTDCKEQAAVDAANAHRAAETAKQAATVAKQVAQHSVHLTEHAKSALKSARDALHKARVDTHGLSTDQKESLQSAEARLREATKDTEYGAVKDAKYAKVEAKNKDLSKLQDELDKGTSGNKGTAPVDELKQMREELKQMRKQLESKTGRKKGDGEALLEEEKALKELEDMIEKLEEDEAAGKKPSEGSASHDELKVEIEKLRDAINRVEVKELEYTIPQKAGGEVGEPGSEEGHSRAGTRGGSDEQEPIGKRRVIHELPASADEPDADLDVPKAAHGGGHGGEGSTPVGSLDVDTAMPFGDLEPFGREDTAQELTEASIRESDGMVDQLERAEVAEEKRAVFRALTRLRGAAITSFDGVARSQTGNIDEYNKIHKWRNTHPLHHLADEESDISKWAFPDNADF